MGNSYSILNGYIFNPPRYVEFVGIPGVFEIPSNGSRIPMVYFDGGYDKCLILSHGNSEDLLQSYPSLRELSFNLQVNVCGYDYQGYGLSQRYTRNANEHACYQNLDDVVEWVKGNGFESENIILYGRSLGSGVVLNYASKKEFHGKIILQSPYTSINDVIKDISSFLGWIFSSATIFPSLENIKRVGNDILFLHGKEDQLISFQHTMKLWDAHKGRGRVVLITKAGHNNVISTLGHERYFEECKQFIDGHLL